jgi:hypothetical protein
MMLVTSFGGFVEITCCGSNVMERKTSLLLVAVAAVLAAGGIRAAATEQLDGELPLDTKHLSVDQLGSVYAERPAGGAVDIGDRRVLSHQETWPKFGPTVDWPPRPAVEQLLPGQSGLPIRIDPIRVEPIK